MNNGKKATFIVVLTCLLLPIGVILVLVLEQSGQKDGQVPNRKIASLQELLEADSIKIEDGLVKYYVHTIDSPRLIGQTNRIYFLDFPPEIAGRSINIHDGTVVLKKHKLPDGRTIYEINPAHDPRFLNYY